MSVRPDAAPQKLVIIEEGLLISMANNPEFLREFPFLKILQTAQTTSTGGCGGCGGRRGADAQRAAIFTNVKQNLASMADDRRRLLKSMLNASQVRITYRQENRIIQHTF